MISCWISGQGLAVDLITRLEATGPDNPGPIEAAAGLTRMNSAALGHVVHGFAAADGIFIDVLVQPDPRLGVDSSRPVSLSMMLERPPVTGSAVTW